MEYERVYTEKLDVKSENRELDTPYPTRIETDRLLMKPLLESVEPSSMYKLYKQYPDTDRWFNTSMGLPRTYGETIELFETIQRLQKEKTDVFYSILEKETGEILGQATIEDIDFDAGKCGIGIWLRKDRWGEGISKERAEGLMYAIFECMEINTIEVRVAKQNEISISAVESYMEVFGGQYDGILRNSSITPKDEVVSMFVWSITAEEFFDNKSDYRREPGKLP